MFDTDDVNAFLARTSARPPITASPEPDSAVYA